MQFLEMRPKDAPGYGEGASLIDAWIESVLAEISARRTGLNRYQTMQNLGSSVLNHS
jgi:hypothetical protein